MPLYRKKPVVIEAFTFEEFLTEGRLSTDCDNTRRSPWHFTFRGHSITHETDDQYLIPTLEGTMKFNRGEMLIVGVKGEIYPCKPDIFAATYEKVEE